jgi:hypothetical protein
VTAGSLRYPHQVRPHAPTDATLQSLRWDYVDSLTSYNATGPACDCTQRAARPARTLGCSVIDATRDSACHCDDQVMGTPADVEF